MKFAKRRGDLPSEDDLKGKAYDAVIIRRLWTYVRPYKGTVGLSLLLLIAVSAVQLVQPLLLRTAIDKYIGRGVLDGLGGVAVLYLLTLVAEFLFRYAQLYILEMAGQNVVLDLRMHVFSHLQDLSASFFDRNPVGKLMTRVTSDVESINEAFTSGLFMIMAYLVKLAGIIGILLWLDWRLALVTFAVLPPMLWISTLFRAHIRSAYRNVRGMVARLNAYLQEQVVGIRLIQLFVRERASISEFDELNQEHRDADLSAVKFDSLFSAVVEMVGSLTLALILWVGGFRILGAGLTFGTLVAFIQYAGRFFQPVQELSQRYAIMQAAMASSERIFELLDTEPEIVSSPQSKRSCRKARGEIEFRNVTFGYDPNRPVLKNVSFKVSQGKKLAVVGWTGAGKSTLIRLLVRLYDVQEGSILLDGIDIREFDLHDLRRSVGIVLQDSFLFVDTVQGNISLGDPAVDEEQVRSAAEAVGADRFIRRLPNRYQEELRERGVNLSAGERQLLSFARALAFDPAVLVLDEATSSVDPVTEQRIEQALQRLTSNRTSIVIAHRLSTVRNADSILVLHQGEVQESGNHQELMAVDGGIYQALYRLQSAQG
jgi:ATP-binding cassette subfamily B multidrug efflux pump